MEETTYGGPGASKTYEDGFRDGQRAERAGEEYGPIAWNSEYFRGYDDGWGGAMARTGNGPH